jgi:hypothetical protein
VCWEYREPPLRQAGKATPTRLLNSVSRAEQPSSEQDRRPAARRASPEVAKPEVIDVRPKDVIIQASVEVAFSLLDA